MPRLLVDGPRFGTSAICTPILRALPDWFGIEEAIVRYSAEIEQLPTFLAIEAEQELGFLSLKLHNPYAAEIYVMAVRPEFHGQGLGHLLVDTAQEWLREQAVEYLQVKTVGLSKGDDPYYSRTRAFYAALGFRPLEEFPTLWNEQNPCLLFIKHL